MLGPDEYHDAYPGREEPGLDNNAYTNVMTAWLMCRALETMEVLPPHLREELMDELRVTEEEVGRWEDLSRRIFVPFHDGVISQFEGYEDLEELDWQDYRSRYGDIGRLDRILEAEGDTPNRYRLSKQADVLMLFYLLSPEELTELFDRLGYPFDPERDVPRNVEYYLARTSDGSTLSGVVHAWVLARIARGRSWEHLMASLETDVADTQGGTTREGDPSRRDGRHGGHRPARVHGPGRARRLPVVRPGLCPMRWSASRRSCTTEVTASGLR